MNLGECVSDLVSLLLGSLYLLLITVLGLLVLFSPVIAGVALMMWVLSLGGG